MTVRTFPAPEHLTSQELEAEMAATCPETGELDQYRVTVWTGPSDPLETHSFAVFLATFADKALYAEQIASDIAEVLKGDNRRVDVKVERLTNVDGVKLVARAAA